MKAAIFDSFAAPLEVRDVPDPTCAADSVVVQVHANGICRSDWHGWMGHDSDVTVPHVPGHELAGTIVELGKNIHNWRIGDRVTVPFACGCGKCRYCNCGQLQVCDNYFQPGFTHWGAFAELVELKYAETNLIRLPDSMDFVTAASLGCRFSTAYRAVVQQGRATAGDWLAVHGCGGVGLSAVMIAAAVGCRIVALDLDAEKLALAKELGAELTINAGGVSDVAQAIHDRTHGGAKISLDALGSQITCRNSILCLCNQGRHVQVGLLAGGEGNPPLPMSAVIARELEVLGSHGMSARDFPSLLQMIERGQLDPIQLVKRRISLREAPDALEQMGQFGSLGITVIDRFSDE